MKNCQKANQSDLALYFYGSVGNPMIAPYFSALIYVKSCLKWILILSNNSYFEAQLI